MTPYYDEDGITIYHGDCREVLPSLTWDIAITDPPYGIGFPYLSYDDSRDGLQSLIADVLPLIDRRAAVLCGPTQIGLYPQPSWVSAVTWNTTGTFGKCGFNQWTPVLCYGPDENGRRDGRIRGDVLRVNGGAGVGFMRGDDEREHTCPKPITVMKQVVLRFAVPTDVIVDPFMGSGTTLVAARSCGHRAIGIEIEERYCEIAAKRLAQRALPLGVA